MKNLELNIFPSVDKKQWLKLAEKQLKGANPDDELSWENDAGLKLEGYYDQSDVDNLQYLNDFFSGLPSHRWKLYESVQTGNPSDANKNSLKALMGGCDGILLDNPKRNDIDTLLKGVDHTICDISLVSPNDINDLDKINSLRSCPNGNCSSSKELSNPIEQLVQLLPITSHTYLYRNALPDFFLEIATVRALRYLLGSQNVHIHTHIPKHQSDEHQWFLNTTAGLASILGGSHSVDFTTSIGDPRISRNTGNLIREESGIEEYTDQCGGSYYIDMLTDKIIQAVTKKLKK